MLQKRYTNMRQYTLHCQSRGGDYCESYSFRCES